MTSAKRWLLPDGVEDILPEEAHKLELLRRDLLDLYAGWGYQLVITPLVEFLDSLLVGASHDLDLHTVKLTDQLSGRMLGIRADITPQAARIDAHVLNREGPARLCYADSVLHTKPRGLLASRVPIRVGAELYGHAGVECDIELICLMHETLRVAEIADVSIVLGHVGIFRTMMAAARLDAETEADLFEAVQRKAFSEIDEIVEASIADRKLAEMLRQLVHSSGGEEVLDGMVKTFAKAPSDVKLALDELLAIVAGVKQRLPGITLSFDLCELRGYEYHTGIVFAAYTPEHGRAVAKGGRYDHIGEVFGRSRRASGFDSDLKTLAKLTGRASNRRTTILAPDDTSEELLARVKALREQGEVVITNLGNATVGAEQQMELNCDRQLVLRDGAWEVEPL